MSEPTHVTVTLSTETIDALAAAAVKAWLASTEGASRPAIGRRTVFTGTSAETPAPESDAAPLYYRRPYAREAIDLFANLPGPQGTRRFEAWLADRTEVTVPEVLEVLAIPPERWTQGLATRIGIALRKLGWEPTGQRTTSGRRDRVYKPRRPMVG